MTTINTDRSAHSMLANPCPSSTGFAPSWFDDGVSIDVTSLMRTINAMFAVGLDLAAARSVAEGQTADRIDRAIAEIDAIISSLRLAVVAPSQTRDTLHRSSR